jgi:hypothetical protein
MKFTKATKDQSKAYQAIIELFVLEECLEAVKWMYRNYFYQFLGPEEDRNDMSKADAGTPALKNFRALFGDWPEVKDEASESAFLKSGRSADDPRILHVLLAWTKEIHAKLSCFLKRGPFHAQSAEKMHGLISPFIQNLQNPEIELDS